MAITRRNQNNQLQSLATSGNLARLVPVIARVVTESIKYASSGTNTNNGSNSGGPQTTIRNATTYASTKRRGGKPQKQQQGRNRSNASFSVPRGVTDSARFRLGGMKWIMQGGVTGIGTWYGDLTMEPGIGNSLFNSLTFGPDGTRLTTYNYAKIHYVSVRVRSVAPATSGGYIMMGYAPNGVASNTFAQLSLLPERKFLAAGENGSFTFSPRSQFDAVIMNAASNPDVDQKSCGQVLAYSELSGIASGGSMYFLDITADVTVWM